MKLWELPSPEKLAEVARQGKQAKPVFVEKAKVAVVAHGKEVNDVTVSPNSKLIASAGHDKLVRIWQFPSLDLLGECKGHRRGVWCVAFSPHDQVIALTLALDLNRPGQLKQIIADHANNLVGHQLAANGG